MVKFIFRFSFLFIENWLVLSYGFDVLPITRFGHFYLVPNLMILGHSVKVIFPLKVESGNEIAILIVDICNHFFNAGKSS